MTLAVAQKNHLGSCMGTTLVHVPTSIRPMVLAYLIENVYHAFITRTSIVGSIVGENLFRINLSCLNQYL